MLAGTTSIIPNMVAMFRPVFHETVAIAPHGGIPARGWRRAHGNVRLRSRDRCLDPHAPRLPEARATAAAMKRLLRRVRRLIAAPPAPPEPRFEDAVPAEITPEQRIEMATLCRD